MPPATLSAEQFPAATLLVIRSHSRAFYDFKSTQLEAIKPAQTYLQARHATTLPGKTSPILVHTFSNGGCLGLARLNEALAMSQPLLKPVQQGIPARSFIFDSCPGTSSLIIWIRAFTAPIKSPFLKWPATGVITLLYAVGGIYNLSVVLILKFCQRLKLTYQKHVASPVSLQLLWPSPTTSQKISRRRPAYTSTRPQISSSLLKRLKRMRMLPKLKGLKPI